MTKENDLSGLDFAVDMMRKGNIEAQLKAAQAELAALREELAKRGQQIVEIAGQRNAAEQRNAVMAELLREILLRRRFTEDMHERIPAVLAGNLDPSTSLRTRLAERDALLREVAESSSENIKVFGERIKETLNPTESGASK